MDAASATFSAGSRQGQNWALAIENPAKVLVKLGRKLIGELAKPVSVVGGRDSIASGFEIKTHEPRF